MKKDRNFDFIIIVLFLFVACVIVGFFIVSDDSQKTFEVTGTIESIEDNPYFDTQYNERMDFIVNGEWYTFHSDKYSVFNGLAVGMNVTFVYHYEQMMYNGNEVRYFDGMVLDDTIIRKG